MRMHRCLTEPFSSPGPSWEPSLKKVEGEMPGYRFTITNQGMGLALMTRLKVIDTDSGLELLPTLWSDNFISLLPGEGKEVHCTMGDQHLPDGLSIVYQSYNMDAPRSVSSGDLNEL
jgi:hypothetical protein